MRKLHAYLIQVFANLRTPRPDPEPEIDYVAILPNDAGGYSLFPVVYESGYKEPLDDGIGNYATLSDAMLRADQNGWTIVQFPVDQENLELFPNEALVSQDFAHN